MLTTGLLLLVTASGAGAHEKGAIHLSNKQAEVGTRLKVRGERLTKEATFRFELRGTLMTLNLGPVQSNEKGIFEVDLQLPAEALAGNYALVLIATDGDESARADFAIIPATTAAADEHAGHEMEGMHMGNAPAATKEMMQLASVTSTGEWSAIIGFAALSLAAGLGLLRRRRA